MQVCRSQQVVMEQNRVTGAYDQDYGDCRTAPHVKRTTRKRRSHKHEHDGAGEPLHVDNARVTFIRCPKLEGCPTTRPCRTARTFARKQYMSCAATSASSPSNRPTQHVGMCLTFKRWR